ncbi:MAG: hypothetical protein GX802_02030 [Clostridiales bacterium]|nr:hypothetical protein [Clostridiales bacterium]
MDGRYGFDKLYFILFIISIILLLFGALILVPIIKLFMLILAFVVVAYALFRVFSRNKYKRSRENLLYLRLSSKVTGFIKQRIKMFRERKTHKFFKCPKCNANLRVPKGKGSIKISCPKCNESFIERT